MQYWGRLVHPVLHDACNALQNLVAGQPEVFKQQLHQMWFSFYSRSNIRDDTSGFEHGRMACLSLLT